MSDMQQLQILSSHKHPIQQLVFSPWPVDGPENNPLVLVSLSEQMCFWNIKYVINNPLDVLKKKNGIRRSSRFSKEQKYILNGDNNGNLTANNDIEVNGNGTNGNGHDEHEPIRGAVVNHTDYWEDKTGASDKRELLACIKFVGNSATKLVTNAEFNQFITIDNEGDIYALQTTSPAGAAATNGTMTMTPEPLQATALTKSFGLIALQGKSNNHTLTVVSS